MTWGRFRASSAQNAPRGRFRAAVDYQADDETLSYESLCEEADSPDKDDNACLRMAYQRAVVSVPLAVKPYSVAGPTNTLCCNDPVITNVRWGGAKKQVCYFTITQEICVEVPVYFGAEAFTGTPGVVCLPASLADCDDCLKPDD